MKRFKSLNLGARIAAVVATVILALIAVFGIYAASYYTADDEAQEILSCIEENDGKYADTGITVSRDWISYTLTPADEIKAGIVFYPGGKVEAAAYLPLAEKFAEDGYLVVIARMPTRFAIFAPNLAGDFMERYEEIDTWYLAGHSLGGAMAANYAEKHADEISGLFLLGAYEYGNFDMNRTLVLYGSEDAVLSTDKLTGEATEIVIDGGNHAGFGNYGAQNGDGTALITNDEQQTQTVELIESFIESMR